MSGVDEDRHSEDASQSPYTESLIILTTVRMVAPFVLTLGMFLALHGAEVGGGFPGGVLAGAAVLMLAFAFGFDPVRNWLRDDGIVGLAVGGVAVFLLVGLGSVALGGGLFEYERYGVPSAGEHGIELVELAIGAIVAGSVVGSVFALDAGVEGSTLRETAAEAFEPRPDSEASDPRADSEASDQSDEGGDQS